MDGPKQLTDRSHLNARNGSELSRATSPSGMPADEKAGLQDSEHPSSRSRPRTFKYHATLPYQVEDDARRQRDLAEILKNLYIAVQAGDYTPGAVHWTRELRSWLSLKFDPTKEQRVKLVKLYYELSLAPGIDPSVSERFSSMFMLLTKYVTPILCNSCSANKSPGESITSILSKTSP